MKNFARHLLLATLLSTTALSGAAFAKGGPDSDGALDQDAEHYAAQYGVSHKEALHRLELQEPIGMLNAALAEAEIGHFAGLWIEHLPEYRIVVSSTDPQARRKILRYVAGTELASLVRVVRAGYTLEKLLASQKAAHGLAQQLGIPVESEIILKSNLVQLYTLNPEELLGRVQSFGQALPEGVIVIGVDRMTQPTANIYGGLVLSTCTSGFSVVNSSSVRGITTAAHCGNSQSYSGTALTFQSADQQGNQDVQWHSAPGFTVTNQFESGAGVRSCTATLSRSSQSVGGYVCGNGMTTGYKCGNISSTTYALSYVTSSASTFIRVDDTEGTDLCEGGDSGGPWFIGNTAYGTHSGCPGADENDAVYMAINYVTSLGVTVLTSP